MGFLARKLGIGPHRTVVELGSGTGKLTRGLLVTGAAIVAVEPIAGMRRVFQRELPSTVVLDGVAEAIPLPTGFADAVVVAQAFQWFRAGPALKEIARVLRPGGGLGLLWNIRDESVPFSRQLTGLIERNGGAARRARDLRWRAAFERTPRRFGPFVRRSFRHSPKTTSEGLVQRVLSESAMAILPPSRQQEVAREVRRILATDRSTLGRKTIRLPYRTDVYVTRLARGPAGGGLPSKRRTTVTRGTGRTSRPRGPPGRRTARRPRQGP